MPREDWVELVTNIKAVLCKLDDRYAGFWGRIVKGDSIECILDHPEDAFEVALILKTFVKAYSPREMYSNGKTSKLGLKIAIGFGSMNTIDRRQDIMDGDAIYRSGRALNDWTGWSKYAFMVSMENEQLQHPCQLIMALINHNINAATPRQCETLYLQLMEGKEKKVSELLGISFQGVYKNLSAIGWTHIKSSLDYFRTLSF